MQYNQNVIRPVARAPVIGVRWTLSKRFCNHAADGRLPH